jgi:hypothetical protein
MRANPQDMGLGMMAHHVRLPGRLQPDLRGACRSGWGSRASSCAATRASAPGLLGQVAVVYTLTWGVMLAIGLVYFFSARRLHRLVFCCSRPPRAAR